MEKTAAAGNSRDIYRLISGTSAKAKFKLGDHGMR